MDIEQKILVSGAGLGSRMVSALCAIAALLVVTLLSACGQKSGLYMPSDPEFKQRATLPDIVRRQLPGTSTTPDRSSSSAPASTPASPAIPSGAGASAPTSR